MPRIHAGRSQCSRATSPAAMITAAAPSVIGGQSLFRSGSTIGSSARMSSTERSQRSWALGLSRALRRLRLATSAICSSVNAFASSPTRACMAARLIWSGHSGATL
jgi:hypothetical protein